jgi:hypothetical protein
VVRITYRLTFTVVGLLLLLNTSSSADAQTKRECRLACQDQINACVRSCGDFGAQAPFAKSCKKAVIQRCRREGLATCLEATSVTTTTVQPPTSTTLGNFRSCFTAAAPACAGPCPIPGQVCDDVNGACLCVATKGLPDSTSSTTTSTTTSSTTTSTL